MSRYIDADVMIARASQDSERMYLESVVRHTPSIDLVRCGECIYWKNSLCQAWHRVIPKDGYCSIGERKESE